LLQFEFGNAVGFFDVPGLGRVEVRSGKWRQQDFDAMLAGLTEVVAGLPFSAAIPTALPYERSAVADHDVLYHAFVYARHILSESSPVSQQLRRALVPVFREPHRRFITVRHIVKPELVHRVDSRTLVSIVLGGFRLTPGGSEKRPYRALLKDVRGLDEGKPELTFDTAENRFVKSFLRGIQFGIVDGMRSAVRASGMTRHFAKRISDDCDEMERLLRPILRHSLWKSVGAMTFVPVASTVLQQRRGYRDVFRHFARLRLASQVPFSKAAIFDLLEVKDIAELYELWCYFAVVEELRRALGPPATAQRASVTATGISVPWDFEVRWAGGARVLYNPHFSPHRMDGRHSYSVPLRPDISLEVPSGPNKGLHLFDAKFRLERLEDLFGSNESVEDDFLTRVGADERRGSFKRGDLYKMHTYRDAIPAARSVWILYPGSEGRFFREPTSEYDDRVAEMLDGVGAIPLSPADGTRRSIRECVAKLLGLTSVRTNA
jgi:hypothetical protein